MGARADATVMAGQQEIVVSNDDGQWVGRREMAQLAHCPEDSIKRDIKQHELQTGTGLRGEVLVRVTDFERIGIKPGDVPAGLTGSQAAELRRVLTDNAPSVMPCPLRAAGAGLWLRSRP